MSLDILNRRFGCDYCELRFKDPQGLKRHTNVVHTKEETFVCQVCATVFYTKYKLDLHQAQKHEINNEFRCDRCKKFFFSDFRFEKHKRKCAFKSCPACGKEFMSNWKLSNHVKGHLKVKSNVCDECGKEFLHGSTLMQHIEIVHQGKRDYECSLCSKTFSRPSSLRTHKLIHTGIKPFPCTLCEKKCREKVQLIKHLKKRHEVGDDLLHMYVKINQKKESDSFSPEMKQKLEDTVHFKKRHNDSEKNIFAMDYKMASVIPKLEVKSEPVENVTESVISKIKDAPIEESKDVKKREKNVPAQVEAKSMDEKNNTSNESITNSEDLSKLSADDIEEDSFSDSEDLDTDDVDAFNQVKEETLDEFDFQTITF